MSEKLQPVASDVVRLDFDSFAEPEKQLFRKIWEIHAKYGLSPPTDVIEGNKEFIYKALEVISWRVLELFMFVMRARMEYYRTRDIFHVMQFLGHRRIENTLTYVQLANSIFKDHDDQYACKVAKTTQEAMQLIELGFDYVTGEYAEGGKLFKKRKCLYLGSSSEGL